MFAMKKILKFQRAKSKISLLNKSPEMLGRGYISLVKQTEPTYRD